MWSEHPRAQEPLLISLHSSLCESACSFNQYWLSLPAPDTKLSASGAQVRVDPGWLLGENKAASCPRVSYCWVISSGKHPSRVRGSLLFHSKSKRHRAEKPLRVTLLSGLEPG